uniref:Methionine--tRNA ligase, mitochondrial n=1 Tax=Lygus hesperus TaxID=30085 RepID=A0A0A9XWG0_LYGHE
MSRLKLLLRPSQALTVTRRKSDYFISTPIYYVNAVPHIGHLYTSLLADASHRFNLLLGKRNTLFCTGTDEHGTKVQQAAAANGVPPDKYCNFVSSQYKFLFDNMDIEYTHFIRTTDEKHKEKVHWFWNKLKERGHIVSGSYAGWYCDADEMFLTDSQLKKETSKDGQEVFLSAESGRPVHWVEESNYKFNLPAFKEDLKRWLSTEGCVKPDKFRQMLLFWLSEGVADREVSVSRPVSRVHWGIPVPGDDTQTVYVWLDALVNYVTVGHPENWPPSVQVLGKDILKFHGIYWPAFLMAADMELPKCLMIHSHWMVDGEKMSKSKGNVVSPSELSLAYSAEGVRYFLLREGTPHTDSNYSDVKIQRILNAELADTLGNLLNRSCGKTVNQRQLFPPLDKSALDQYCLQSASEVMSAVESLQSEVKECYTDMNFYRGVAEIMSSLHAANRFFEASKPWELRKSPENQKHLEIVLHITMETLRIAGIALSPIVPALSKRLLDKLNVHHTKRKWDDMTPSWLENNVFDEVSLNPERSVLFKKLQ